jgi:hypothetical protein
MFYIFRVLTRLKKGKSEYWEVEKKLILRGKKINLNIYKELRTDGTV